MNGFLKAEFLNMWTATLQNKKSFKRLISKLDSFANDTQKRFKFIFLILFFSLHRDHYVEGKMRGLAPSKKIAAVQQKNVDL